jgi:hypothetical protein
VFTVSSPLCVFLISAPYLLRTKMPSVGILGIPGVHTLQRHRVNLEHQRRPLSTDILPMLAGHNCLHWS